MGKFGDAFFVVVDSGQRVSGQFFIGGGADRLTVLTGSRSNATDVFIAVAATSGGPFSRITRTDGAGTAYVVAASANGGVVAGQVWPMPPSLYARFEVTSGPTAVETYTLIGMK